MVDIQTVSIAIASAGVFLAAIYYIFQIRHQTAIRKTDLVIRLYSRMQTDEFIDAYSKIMRLQFKDNEDFVRQYGPRYSEEFHEMGRALSKVGGLFELVGTLLYRKHIDLGTVYDVFGVSIIKQVYEKTKPLTLADRNELDEPVYGAGFEYLYNELVRKEPQLRKTWVKAFLQPVSDTNSSNQSSRC